MKEHLDAKPPRILRSRAISSIALVLLALPLATALVGIIKTSVNIPLTDDYDAISDFLYRYVHLHGFFARIGWILTAQHNQYKLMLLNTVVALQYHLIGNIDYRALQLLGDVSIPVTLWLLWLLIRRQQRPFGQTTWLILVPWYLFLSLCYFETVNWANTEIQELVIIPVVIACVLLFTSSVRHAAFWGTLLLILSIATFAAGFTFAIALVVLVACQRRFRACLAIVLATCVMGGLYSVHYTSMPMARSLHHPAGLLAFALAFLGGLFPTVSSSIAFGVILIAGFLFLLTRGWIRLSPDTFCIALFCLMTAAAVAPGRYHEGLQSAMASRYQLYPILLICAEYLAVLQIFVPQRLGLPSSGAAAIGLATACAMAFGITSQMHGYRNLHARQRLLLTHLILWERHPDRLVLIPDEPGYYPGDNWIPFRIHAEQIMQQSIAAGLYIPPVSANDPLPVKPHSQSTLGIEDEAWPPNPAARP